MAASPRISRDGGEGFRAGEEWQQDSTFAAAGAGRFGEARKVRWQCSEQKKKVWPLRSARSGDVSSTVMPQMGSIAMFAKCKGKVQNRKADGQR